MQTLKGRDDKDNRIGAFSSIFTLSEANLADILGHASYVMFYLYVNDIEDTVIKESAGGQLDYKNVAYIKH